MSTLSETTLAHAIALQDAYIHLTKKAKYKQGWAQYKKIIGSTMDPPQYHPEHGWCKKCKSHSSPFCNCIYQHFLCEFKHSGLKTIPTTLPVCDEN